MMKKLWIAGLALSSASIALAAADYSPNPAADYQDRVFFGDTHLYTAYSADAGMIGNFLGPKYTSVLKGDNMHRVVIFQNGKDKVGSVLTFSANESNYPEDLWAYIEAYEKSTGGSVLAQL